MSESKSANIHVNLNEGSFTIAGSEEFVEKNKGDVFSFIEKNINSAIVKQSQTAQMMASTDCEKPVVSQQIPQVANSEDKYIQSGVYHIDKEDKTISILKTVPGTSKADKVKNIAMIVLYIRKGKIPGKEIISICEKHKCYDSANFASIFKKEGTNIIKKGKGQSWTIELSHPGEQAAVELLEEMSIDKK